MFSADPPGGARPETYTALKNAKTTIITTPDYDVFGDGSVIIKQAPGHTEGHSVLFVKLANTGNVVLSGDLYHYPAERRLHRVPTFEVNQAADGGVARGDREVHRADASQLWIQHDLAHHRQLKKSPEYYD